MTVENWIELLKFIQNGIVFLRIKQRSIETALILYAVHIIEQHPLQIFAQHVLHRLCICLGNTYGKRNIALLIITIAAPDGLHYIKNCSRFIESVSVIHDPADNVKLHRVNQDN